MMKSLFLTTLVALGVLQGCAQGQVRGNMVQSGQWTEPMPLGNNRFYLKGHGDRDAINGANSSCASHGRRAVIEQLIPATMREGAKVTFTCN